ncbi:MAG: nitrilase-related carbon-nitrogen hydrolase, partial [Pseudomonadota bacterium]
MSAILRCGLIQADTRWLDPAANQANLAGLIDEIPDCDLYVLPETCMHGFMAGPEIAESMAGDSVHWLRQQATARAAMIAGGVLVQEHERVFNRMIVAHPDGRIEHYDKRHLFTHGGETEAAGYSKGVQRHRMEWHDWRIDLQICYDLRFPVWCRNNASPLKRFDLQLFIANWPTPRIDAWTTLLKARAIENQAYVIGVNRCGTDGNGIDYLGRSVAF